jgi:hypothetical protein
VTLSATAGAASKKEGLTFSDFDWLEKFPEKNPQALAHHVEEKRIVLTADTRDLQKFVLQHLGQGELFAKPAGMIRKSTAAVAGGAPAQ